MANLKVDKINNSDVTKGVATLDENGQLPFSQLPSVVLQAVLWRGLFDSETNTPPLQSGDGRSGDMYAVSVASENVIDLDGITKFNVGDILIYSETRWQIIRDRNTVISVCGKVGVVNLDKTDVGLSQVDNTSDVNKPISNSTYNALNEKVDKVEGKKLTDNNYTNEEKSKLGSLNNFSGKGSDVTLDTSAFINNLEKDVNTVQKLAFAVDSLHTGSTGGFICGDVKYTLRRDVEDGWYELDGRTIYKENDLGLWNLFGDNLPDCRGIFIRAANYESTGYDPERYIGTMQEDTIQGHGHQMNVKLDTRATGGSRNFYSADSSALERQRETEFESLMKPTTLTNYGTVRVSNETRPRNIAMRLIIKR